MSFALYLDMKECSHYLKKKAKIIWVQTLNQFGAHGNKPMPNPQRIQWYILEEWTDYVPKEIKAFRNWIFSWTCAR